MKMQLSPEQQRLVVENVRLAFYVAKKYQINNHDYDDIVSLANIGLVKAATTYDSSKGIRFATYATTCMNNEILMAMRKESRYAGTVSLDDIIGSEDNIFLKDVIPDPESDFTVEIELDDDNSNKLKSLIEFTLNDLEGKTRLVFLYYIAGKQQRWIEEKVGLSQSYISRLEKRLAAKIRKKTKIKQKECDKECFIVDITKRGYQVTFSSKETSNFNKVFARFLRNIDTSQYIPNFKMSCNEGRVSISMFEDIQCLEFIADIIQEMDNFDLSFKVIEPISVYEEEIFTDESGDESEVVITEETSTDGAGDSVKPVLVVKESGNNINQDETKKEKIFPKIMASFLEKDEFTVAQIRKEFPDVDGAYVGYCAHMAKKSGLIVSTGRGKYSVVKKADANEEG